MAQVVVLCLPAQRSVFRNYERVARLLHFPCNLLSRYHRSFFYSYYLCITFSSLTALKPSEVVSQVNLLLSSLPFSFFFFFFQLCALLPFSSNFLFIGSFNSRVLQRLYKPVTSLACLAGLCPDSCGCWGSDKLFRYHLHVFCWNSQY